MTRCHAFVQVRPGYFRLNRHLRAAPDRFAQFLPPTAAASMAVGHADDTRFGWPALLQAQRLTAARRAARPKRTPPAPPPPAPKKRSEAKPPPAPRPKPKPAPSPPARRPNAAAVAAAAAEARPPPPEVEAAAAEGTQEGPAEPRGGEAAEAEAQQAAEAVHQGLNEIMQLRGLGGAGAAARPPAQGEPSPRAALQPSSLQASSELGAGHGGMMRALTALQLGLLAWVGVQLCDRTARGRRLLRETGAMLSCCWRGATHRGRTPSRGRAQPMDSRLLGELT